MLDELFSGEIKVPGYIAQEACQRANSERRVAWDGDVVLAIFERGQTEVATGLTSDPVPEIGEGFREVDDTSRGSLKP